MARTIKYVTRTINSLKAVCTTFHVPTGNVEEVTFSLQSGITEEKALDWLRANVETGERKIIMVKEFRKEEKCYALSEVEFMKYAHEVDAKTRKAIESEETPAQDEPAQDEPAQDEPAQEEPVQEKPKKK